MNLRAAQLAVLAAATAVLAPAFALARHLGPDELGPETRVGVFSDADENDVGLRDDSSAETHQGISLESCENAVGSRWYLQPEPALRDPLVAVAYAYAGHSTAVYSYALNNPVAYWDENGQYPIFSDDWNDCYQACLDRTGAKEMLLAATPVLPVIPKELATGRNPTMGGAPSPTTSPLSVVVNKTGGRTGPIGFMRDWGRYLAPVAWGMLASSATSTGLCMVECSKKKSLGDQLAEQQQCAGKASP